MCCHIVLLLQPVSSRALQCSTQQDKGSGRSDRSKGRSRSTWVCIAFQHYIYFFSLFLSQCNWICRVLAKAQIFAPLFPLLCPVSAGQSNSTMTAVPSHWCSRGRPGSVILVATVWQLCTATHKQHRRQTSVLAWHNTCNAFTFLCIEQHSWGTISLPWTQHGCCSVLRHIEQLWSMHTHRKLPFYAGLRQVLGRMW